MILVLMMRIPKPCLEIIYQKSKSIFINTTYRQPCRNKENFENHFGKFLKKAKTKITYLLCDFNLNLLDYDANCKHNHKKRKDSLETRAAFS